MENQVSVLECPSCGAEWSAGAFTAGCPACGGGAMARDCPVCDGACGAEWRRAAQDSLDAGEAHWLGTCAYEWRIDEPALPNLRWARLFRAGETVVVDCDGLHYGFRSAGETLRWLSEEEYIPFTDAIADGRIPPETLPPSGAP